MSNTAIKSYTNGPKFEKPLDLVDIYIARKLQLSTFSHFGIIGKREKNLDSSARNTTE